MGSARDDVSTLLKEWAAGDSAALERLLPLIAGEVRDLARRQLAREHDAGTLQPTALVNEAFLRLLGRRTLSWQNRRQFFAALAELMRFVLVDNARRHRARKRGHEIQKIPLDDWVSNEKASHPRSQEERQLQTLMIDQALTALAEEDPQKARIAELRFFLGLRGREIAESLEVSPNTVSREWARAKIWIYEFLSERWDEKRSEGIGTKSEELRVELLKGAEK